MANISTVYLRVIRKDTPLHLDFGTMTDALLNGEYGIKHSYSTPLWANYDTRHEWLDLVYGVRWVPGMEVNQLWTRVKNQASAIFIRYYDEGDDYDRIWHINDQNYQLDNHKTREIPDHEKPRRCRYAFDEIRWIGQAASLGESKISSGEYQLKLTGSYCADNPKHSLYGQELFQDPSRIPEIALISWEPRERKHESDKQIKIEEKVRQVAEIYRFYFHGRLVSEVIRSNLWQPNLKPGSLNFDLEEENWLEFHYDGWDNCLDPAYQEVLAELPQLQLF